MWLDPAILEVPDVRITSTWDPEMLKMFGASIDADGIQVGLNIVHEGTHFWIVDGKHRKEEALLKGIPKVPCDVLEGTMRQVMTRNLYLNRLRGGTKASEMVKVIYWLESNEHMSIDEIRKETGLGQDYIEKMLQCSKAEVEVIDELDQEHIGVGHAWEIARVQDRDTQLRLLAQVLQYRLTVKVTKEVVDGTLEIINARQTNPAAPPAPVSLAVPTIKCHSCEQDWPVKKVVGANICMWCYGMLQDAVIKARKEGALPQPEQPSNTSK